MARAQAAGTIDEVGSSRRNWARQASHLGGVELSVGVERHNDLRPEFARQPVANLQRPPLPHVSLELAHQRSSLAGDRGSRVGGSVVDHDALDCHTADLTRNRTDHVTDRGFLVEGCDHHDNR